MIKNYKYINIINNFTLIFKDNLSKNYLFINFNEIIVKYIIKNSFSTIFSIIYEYYIRETF